MTDNAGAGDDLVRQLQAALGNAYTIDRELGGGGMSRVFLATEAALGRSVVIKLLPPELAAGVSTDRFKREILMAARLQHPHIVPVHSAGESNGLPYFTMPFVEGESLRARLAKRGELPVSEGVRVLREIASALAYAHERGIVHRDIKPDNVLMSGGAAMVTDFGVAKALSQSSNGDHAGVTSLGLALGTPSYMSPEQASADPTVDHRADLYAFGVLAYELLTGQTPFGGRTPQGLLAAHVTELPEPIQKRRPSLPVGLSALVMRCLEKRPADRPQSADEVVKALDDITTPSGGMSPTDATSVTSTANSTNAVTAEAVPRARSRTALVAGITALVVVAAGAYWQFGRSGQTSLAGGTRGDSTVSSLAVLPFENIGGDTATAYFADGVTDELATALAKVPGLRVASRTSSYSFRKRDGLDIPAIAERLHVVAILDGAVRRAGNQLRINAKLTRASDGIGIWADAFTVEASDNFDVQTRLSQSIMTALASTLGAVSTDKAPRNTQAGTQDAAAYDAYLRARYEVNRRGAGVAQSIPLFEQAVGRDPQFASAWAGLAFAWSLSQEYTANVDPVRALREVERAAAKAMSLDSMMAEPIGVLGFTMTRAGDYARAEPLLKRALQLDPRSSMAYRRLSIMYNSRGQFAEEERLLRAAVELDPFDGVGVSGLAATVSLDTARWPEARALARRAVAIAPNNSGALSNAASTLLNTRDFAESLELARRAGIDPTAFGVAAAAFVNVGLRDSALAIVAAFQKLPPNVQLEAEMSVALAALGNYDQAFAAASSAVDKSRSMSYMVQNPMVWHPVAADRRLQSLCARTQAQCDDMIARIARTPPKDFAPGKAP
jgi:eukaryotic-like serine/threonine-protein kinase